MREEILNLLNLNNTIENGIFIPKDIEMYVDQILLKAKLFLLHEGGKLQGFIAFYDNDLNKKSAFLSMLLIDKNSQGKGLGSLLLETVTGELKKNGFHTFKLEVLKVNKKAIDLYEKKGFVFDKDNGKTQYMIKNL